MKKILLVILLSLTLPFLVMTIGCGHKSEAWEMMGKAESIMDTVPDSALALLSAVDQRTLGDEEEKARYALLMSMALDKNYIDTTSFDVLQPAIDYYLDNGTADERLRTLFYQGIIFLNRSDYDQAMESFLKAEDLNGRYTDTLTFAHMLVAQGAAYAQSYQIQEHLNHNLMASELYKRVGERRRELSSLLRALNSSMILDDKGCADSIMDKADSLVELVPELREKLVSLKRSHTIFYAPDDTARMMLDSISASFPDDNETKIDLAQGYLRLNEPQKAYAFFKSVDTSALSIDVMKYKIVKAEVLEANQNFKAALAAFKDYHFYEEVENIRIYSQKTRVARDRHKMEIEHMSALRHRDLMLWSSLFFCSVLIIVVGGVYYQMRLKEEKRINSEKEKERLGLENINLRQEKYMLELQKRNAELEQDKQKSAMENMRKKIDDLVEESEHLKALLKKGDLPDDIQKVIRERFNVLNGLLAAKITGNDKHAGAYDEWIEKVTKDRNSFMDSVRLACWASHPAFMRYLAAHGLNDGEMNYVCLYAIDLIGKEIGDYIQKKRHYHDASEIRKKLGLKENDKNLGPYIRKLLNEL